MTRNRLTARHYDIGREAFKKKSAVAPVTHSATSAATAGEVPENLRDEEIKEITPRK